MENALLLDGLSAMRAGAQQKRGNGVRYLPLRPLPFFVVIMVLPQELYPLSRYVFPGSRPTSVTFTIQQVFDSVP